NPALRRNRRRLDYGESDPACSPAANVNQMPIVRETVVGAVLAHRRHYDPIPKGDPSYRKRTEQINVGDFPVMVHARRAAVSRACSIVNGQLSVKIIRSHVLFLQSEVAT